MNLSFLSKLAFICNICLLIAWSMKYHTLIPVGDVQSTIIITGLVLSFFINLVVNTWYAVVLIQKKVLSRMVPTWLAITNFLFLILQLYLVLA